MRRLAIWLVAWIVSGALYLLLIDLTVLPELLVGVCAAMLAATGFELARDERSPERFHLRWLARLHRPLMKVPGDVAIVSWVAITQLLRRAPSHGVFRAVRFASASDEAHERGRRAFAEALGSFAPNTIVVGVDDEHELILAHQLRRSGGADAIDLMELG